MATFYYFGGSPTTVIFQTTDNFNGTAFAPSVVAAITPGLSVFPAQAGGGLLNFHLRPVKIQRLDNVGAGTLTVTLEHPTTSVPIATLTPAAPTYEQDFILPVGSALKVVSTGTGAKSISITGLEAGPNGSL